MHVRVACHTSWRQSLVTNTFPARRRQRRSCRPGNAFLRHGNAARQSPSTAGKCRVRVVRPPTMLPPVTTSYFATNLVNYVTRRVCNSYSRPSLNTLCAIRCGVTLNSDLAAGKLDGVTIERVDAEHARHDDLHQLTMRVRLKRHARQTLQST